MAIISTGSAREFAVDTSQVRTREDLAAYLDALSRQVAAGDRQHSGALADFLESAAGWVADMDGFFLNRGEPMPDAPTWEMVAMIFTAALVYE